MTTHWSFSATWRLGNSRCEMAWQLVAVHTKKYYIKIFPKRAIWFLDQFAGGGTTLVEAKLLNRDIIE